MNQFNYQKKHQILMMMIIIIITLICSSLIKYTIAGAYDLPAGTLNQTGITELKRTFKCEAEGYFADVDNECKIYHHCNSFNTKKGSPNIKYQQNTMACGINQIFDQSKFACINEDDAIPCEASSDFFYLNERIGDETADFLTDADIEKAQAARPEYKRKRRREVTNKRVKRLKDEQLEPEIMEQLEQYEQQPGQESNLFDLDIDSSNHIDDKIFISSPKLIKISSPSINNKKKLSKKNHKKSMKSKNKKNLHNNKKRKQQQQRKSEILIFKINKR